MSARLGPPSDSRWDILFFITRVLIISPAASLTDTNATIPTQGRKSVQNWLTYRFPDAQYATSENVHSRVAQLDESFHSLQDYMSKVESKESDVAQKELLLGLLKPDETSLIFVNKTNVAIDLLSFLQEKGWEKCDTLHKVRLAVEKS